MTGERTSTISHVGWMLLAAEEYRRMEALLATVSAEQWNAPTDCTGWRVRDVVAHLTGAAEATASIREQLRQQRLGRRFRGDRWQIDAVNELQVRERAVADPTVLRRLFAQAARRGLRARARLPRPVRAMRLPFPPPVGWATLGFLYDTVHTRDAWMHRIDICRATDTPIELSRHHDALVLADAVREWQRGPGHADAVVLTGPAGGTFPGRNRQVAAVSCDAVEFARALSGRCSVPGVLAHSVLF